MIQAKLLEMVLKAILKHPKMRDLFKYKDEPNECDRRVDDLEKKLTDTAFKVTATIDMVKRYSEDIDNTLQDIKRIKKKVEEFKKPAEDVKWMVGIFNKMKKVRLLKSIFKNGK